MKSRKLPPPARQVEKARKDLKNILYDQFKDQYDFIGLSLDKLVGCVNRRAEGQKVQIGELKERIRKLDLGVFVTFSKKDNYDEDFMFFDYNPVNGNGTFYDTIRKKIGTDEISGCEPHYRFHWRINKAGPINLSLECVEFYPQNMWQRTHFWEDRGQKTAKEMSTEKEQYCYLHTFPPRLLPMHFNYVNKTARDTMTCSYPVDIRDDLYSGELVQRA